MKIIVGCKVVPEEQDILVQRDGTLDMSKAAPKISQFDLNAIQAAEDLRGMVGEASVTALSVGGKALENSKVRKDILSRGPDELAVVVDESLEGALPDRTARVLAGAVNRLGFDLVLCGDGSGDLYAQQVAVRLGALLVVPAVGGVSRIVSASADRITVERTLEREVEVLEIPLPAVVAVSADINIPAIPGMKAILRAAKKPVNALALGDVNPDAAPDLVVLEAVKAPKRKERKRIVIEGDGKAQLAEFVGHLRKIIN